MHIIQKWLAGDIDNLGTSCKTGYTMRTITLDEYLYNEGLSEPQFAAKIGKSVSFVNRLRRGLTWPLRETSEAIIRATKGKVTPNDFLKDPFAWRYVAESPVEEPFIEESVEEEHIIEEAPRASTAESLLERARALRAQRQSAE